MGATSMFARSDRLTALAKLFAASNGGSIYVMFALGLIPVIGVMGATVDYGRENYLRDNLQLAVDTALVAAAEAQQKDASTAEAAFSQALEANWMQNDAKIPITSQYTVGSGVLSGTANIDAPTTFLRIFGFDSIPIGVTSQVKFGSGDADVALVLDNTGSMAGAKIAGLQDAATALVDTLIGSPAPGQNVRVGLVPFTDYVNVGLGSRNEPWLSVPNDSSVTTNQCDWNTPVVSRTNCTTVTTTSTCSSTNDGVTTSWPCTNTEQKCDMVYGTPVYSCHNETESHKWRGCVGSRNYPLDMSETANAASPVPGIMDIRCASPLQRLTTDASTLKAQISSMVANGETFLHPGLLWGWRVLSPSAPFADGAPYGSSTRKIMILMTDGANTKSPNYPEHESTNVLTANNLTAQVCANIKAEGIRIYTIAFEIDDVSAQQLLLTCSSGIPYYYNANTVSELKTAFQEIGNSIASNLRFVK